MQFADGELTGSREAREEFGWVVCFAEVGGKEALRGCRRPRPVMALACSLDSWSAEDQRAHCLCRELALRGLPFERERQIPVEYKGVLLDCGYRLDLVVDGRILVEVKSVERVLPIHQAQAITYLKLAKLDTALLVNFNVSAIKFGLRRLARKKISS